MANHSPNPARRTAFIADTVALILFFTTTGIINERFIAGMTWDQVFQARLTGAVLMVPVARPYGLWRDFLMKRASDTRISQLLWDSLALEFSGPDLRIDHRLDWCIGSRFILGHPRGGGNDALSRAAVWRVPKLGEDAVRSTSP
ncbi:hypothetical protein GCM10010924_58640 [Rhizobium wenxiniae]|uniref:Uncharacterized protein n=1 Tax=Rhizobium wenxiniae TaxID=1737357 RepID=A0A7W9YCV8_9HYPH|nr:hypothetical protein [Rhizobium wenxiniae]GGG21498.1 hypothetical protein GCM10010924_58640 [Rhizobium wenxiniae]